MPHAFVTGSNGFVGLNLVRALVAQGYQVTANYRPGTSLHSLAELGVSSVAADITDARAISRVLPAKLDVVFHVAGSMSFWKSRDQEQTIINVDGTRNVVRAALSKNTKRLVYTSSVAAFGPESGDELDESSELRGGRHWINYYRSKWLAEQEVHKALASGLDAVFINPGHILGPGDLVGWGRIFSQAKARRVRGTPSGSAPFCHIDDVVQAHLVAARAAPKGARYLLGSAQASYRQFFELVYRCLGGSPPPPVPAWLLKGYGHALVRLAPLWGSAPSVTPEFAHVLSTRFCVRQKKAENELGVGTTSLQRMVQDTHRWLVDNGQL